MDYKGRLRPYGVPFSGWKCIKGRVFTSSSIEKVWDNYQLTTDRVKVADPGGSITSKLHQEKKKAIKKGWKTSDPA